MDQSLTVVVPVFNEEESLDQLVVEMDKFIPQAPGPVEVLFVNDGSTDDSQSVIDRICREKQAYHYISLKQNRGLSAAIKAGIDHAQTALIGYIDADIQTTPEDFMLFYPHLEEHAMVIGIRVDRNDGFVKRMSSTIANSVRRALINDGIADTGCPLKIVQADYAKRVPFFTGMHRFLPALIQLQGGKVKQIPVRHFPRYAGTPKYNLGNRLIGPLMDTFAFRWMRSRYINYEVKSSDRAER
jgi:glycosyltransferase involved in cell wall biosynthesis